MPVKPSNLTYGLDEKPPVWVSFFLGFQHICIIAIGLIFPVVIIRETGGSPEQASRLVAASMIGGAIGVFVQALKRGPVGSGYLCPQLCGPSFLTASILAVKTGGLSLLFGMTTLAGIFEGFLSRIIHRVRFLFPTEVTGLIVAMVGITVIKLAALNFFGLSGTAPSPDLRVVTVSIFTLAVMVGLNVWSKGKLKLFCILIGMLSGYVASYAAGILGPESFAVIASSSFFAVPFSGHPGWSFNLHLLIPTLVATLCSTLKSVGDLTTCQKINDAEWKRPDMENIGKGILADSAGALAAGLLGGVGQSTSSSNIGLSIATGATSRIIASFIAGMLVIMAFFPKISSVFAIMPQPVVGATLIFALSFMVVAGIQIIVSRMIDSRKTFVVGVSLIFGLTVDMVPQAYSHLPAAVQPVFTSSLSAATVMAVILNLIFRIGIAQKAELVLNPGENHLERLRNFFDRQGGLWGVRREVIVKVQAAVHEFAEAALAFGIFSQPVRVTSSFDEYNLNVAIQYSGERLVVPQAAPTSEELLHDDAAAARLALLLMDYHADKVRSEKGDDTNRLLLHFNH